MLPVLLAPPGEYVCITDASWRTFTVLCPQHIKNLNLVDLPDAYTQCLTNVGLPSTTLAQHWSNIGQMFAGTVLFYQRRRRSTNIEKYICDVVAGHLTWCMDLVVYGFGIFEIKKSG